MNQILEIVPEQPYAEEKLNYNVSFSRTTVEQKWIDKKIKDFSDRFID